VLEILVGAPLFLIIISLIVTFHELGHFTVARLFKTRVERFSVGFGPILLSRKDKHGIEWCISALPLGGYVKFAGDENITSMMPSTEDLEASRALITDREGAAAVNDYFHFKPLWQRFLIILAGPASNFVLAILVFTALTLVMGETLLPSRVGQVMPGSPAAAAGFQPGDLIERIDGHDVRLDADHARMLIILRADTPTSFVVQRNGQDVVLSATPKRAVIDPTGKDKTMTGGQLGILFDLKPQTRRVGPLKALAIGNTQTWQALETNLIYIGRIFTGHENASQIGGIVGMTKASGDMAVAIAQTQTPLWIKVVNLVLNEAQLMAYISIGVGFLNLLPIPLLDGGHLAFYAYQSVVKKPIPTGIQNAAFRVAIVLVLGLMLFAFWNDANHTGLVSYLRGLF
jgi:regulator of sigma E protease